MRVLKFGGTSVANAQRFQDVAEIVLPVKTEAKSLLRSALLLNQLLQP